ncbi:MAG: hypothetical protein V8T45_11680 [Oscillospiraceae bacterium]
MDNRRVIKFFPKSGDSSGEVGKLINIMRDSGYELLSFTLAPSSAATLVFEHPADMGGSLSVPGTDGATGA